jgi:hypothetical protein
VPRQTVQTALGNDPDPGQEIAIASPCGILREPAVKQHRPMQVKFDLAPPSPKNLTMVCTIKAQKQY